MVQENVTVISGKHKDSVANSTMWMSAGHQKSNLFCLI